MSGDLFNGLFELVGGVLIWLHTKVLLKDKCVRGVSLLPFFFFTSWGFWNLYYYPSLDQWWSFYGGLFVVVANATWTVLALYYKYFYMRGIKI